MKGTEELKAFEFFSPAAPEPGSTLTPYMKDFGFFG
jgi:hypothetical protein